MTGRRPAVLVALVLGAAGLACSAFTWVQAAGRTALDPQVAVTVAGTVAAPGAGAAGLTLLAAGLALGLVRRAGRWVVVAVVVASGVVAAASAVAVLADPVPAARAATAQLTGVGALLAAPTLTPAPYVMVVVGALAVALGLGVALTPRRWAQGSQRHERPTTAPEAGSDDRSDWDALSRGEDPS